MDSLKIIHYFQGKEVNPPINDEDTFIQGNKDNDGLEIATTVKSYTWIDAEAAILHDVLTSGVNGTGQGILAGFSHQIKIVEGATVITVLDGYIDLQTAVFDRNQVIADSVPKYSIDWLDSVADSVTFENLYNDGFLLPTKLHFVPYVLTSIPNYSDTLLISFSTIYIVNELSSQTKRIVTAALKSGSVVDSFGGIVDLIAEIAYTILLLASLFKLFFDIVDLMIQEVKYKPSMLINDQIEAACTFLGLKYDAGILGRLGLEKAHIIPASYSNIENQSDRRILGFIKPDPADQTGYYKGSLGDLLRELRILFNTKYSIVNKTLVVSLNKQIKKSATFKLPPIENNRFETNASEMISNYTVSFAFDTTEKNTMESWEGNNVQATLNYISAPPNELRLLKGLERRASSFARGYVKDELTSAEKFVDLLYKVISFPLGVLIGATNGVITVVNEALDLLDKIANVLSNFGININPPEGRPEKINNPANNNPIQNRLGMLKLETDFFSTDKIVLLDVNDDPSKTKLAPLNDTILDAEYIYLNFHRTNSFAPTPVSAQRYIYNYDNVQMNLTEFKQAIDDGAVKLPTGEVCEIKSYEYNAYDRIAKFVIELKKLFTNNLREVITKPKGR